jgi:RNA polymerase sigma-70 factor (sigma-E family)
VEERDEGRGSVTFDEFTGTRLAPLLRFAKVLCVDAGLAEDVVQEVLIRAHARWDRIGQLDKPDAYVRRMIVNEFVSWRRKWARVVPVAVVADRADPSDHAGAHAERAELLDRLRSLPRQQRAVVVLRYYGGLSDAEIADELGCGVSTVRSNASRALASLRITVTEARLTELKEA